MTTEPAPPVARTAAGYEFSVSRNFRAWLADNRCALAFSTYQAGALFLLGLTPAGKLHQSVHRFSRCMGLCGDGDKLWAASLHQLWRFSNHADDLARQQGYDRIYRPRVCYVTGDLDVHELAEAADGELAFINTLHSCLATTSVERSFRELWRPRFISRLAAEDRCHLNGLAMREGSPFAVTAISTTDVAQGWREHRRDGGVAIDVASGELLCTGLSMPHSPRWAHGRLWLLNSGAGGFGYVDAASGRFHEIAFCPGFARGLSIIGRYAVIGLSRPRENGTFGGLALQQRLTDHRVSARCGLMIVDLESGSAIESLQISGSIQELFDVAILRDVRQPLILGDPRTPGDVAG